MIPNIIHFIWIGNKQMPREYASNIGAANILNKDWQTAIWLETHTLDLINDELFSRETNAAAKADLLRLELIYRFGGIYSDCDITWFKPFESLNLNPDKLSVVQESGSVVNNAFLASKAGNPVVLELIRRCKGRAHHKVLPARYGPALLMEVLRDYPSDIEVVSNRVITSRISAGPKGLMIPNKVAFHGYDNSWFGW